VLPSDDVVVAFRPPDAAAAPREPVATPALGPSPVHGLSYEGHTLRFMKGPRFDGDLPWWIAEDLFGCIADLLGRPDQAGPMLQHLLDECSPLDRAEVTVAEAGGAVIRTAVSEFELVPVIVAMGESRHPRLRALADWFARVPRDAAVGGDVQLACARRGIDLGRT
jgi:hypothetical protein